MLGLGVVGAMARLWFRLLVLSSAISSAVSTVVGSVVGPVVGPVAGPVAGPVVGLAVGSARSWRSGGSTAPVVGFVGLSLARAGSGKFLLVGIAPDFSFPTPSTARATGRATV